MLVWFLGLIIEGFKTIIQNFPCHYPGVPNFPSPRLIQPVCNNVCFCYSPLSFVFIKCKGFQKYDNQKSTFLCITIYAFLTNFAKLKKKPFLYVCHTNFDSDKVQKHIILWYKPRQLADWYFLIKAL